MQSDYVVTQLDLCDWLAGAIRDSEKLAAIEADLLLGEHSQTLSWLKQFERSVSLLDEIGTPEGMRRWRERRRKGQRAETLAQDNDLDIPRPPDQTRNVASGTSSSPNSIDDFVQREVSRLLNTIENSSTLLGRKDLRWFRDNVVESARTANLLTTAEDDRVLHVALSRSIRPIRRENARVTFESGLDGPKEKGEAQRLLNRLDAQDLILADFRTDEEFAHVALWYQLAEDAALSDDEVAALWEEDPAIISKALEDPRAAVLVEQRRIAEQRRS